MKKSIYALIPYAVILLFVFVSCQKEINPPVHQEEFSSAQNSNSEQGHLQQTKTFSSEVVLKWFDLEYRILLQPQEQNTGFDFSRVRYYAYVGIALYESVVPGMPAYQSLSGQLSEMPPMPATIPGLAYHWPTCANAALAYMHRNFLPNTSAANKASIDSLENALNNSYRAEVNTTTFQRSVNFGKTVAQLVFNWSKTDGLFTTYPPYVPPVGPGLWIPTPPNFSPAAGVVFGKLRPLMPGVLDENAPGLPTSFSTDPSSAFFKDMKEVYDVSLILTPEQRAQANYWRGTMGGSPAIHWFAILKKVLIEQGNDAMLDKAALAYCKMGMAQLDATISTFKAIYQYNQLRPITYIRNVIGNSGWNSVFPANSSPGYPEAVTTDYSSSAAVLSQEFGDNYHFNTDGTNNLGSPGYTFDSFEEAGIHGGFSRFYAGISTKASVNAGILIGNKTAGYMKNKIKFLKE